MHVRTFLVTIFLLLYLASCRKNSSSLSNTDVPPESFSQVFDQFWNNMNTNYVYWDVDTTNWDDMYNRFRSQFSQLNLQNDNDVQRSLIYFRQMTKGLIDAHYSINFVPPVINGSYIFPALERKENTPGFHSSFLYLSVDSGYFDAGYRYGEYVNAANEQLYAACAIINKQVLYFTCSQFSLEEAWSATSNNGVKAVLQYFFNQLQNLPDNIKGIILDVRNNKGGDVVDLNFLMGHFITSPLHIGYTHYKSGNGRLAFTPWIRAFVQPVAGGNDFNIPIIALADNYTRSLAEIVAMAVHTLPTGKVVGENTWGATGPITDKIVYNDGQFSIPGFLSVYTSSAAFKYANGNRYEGVGFPPDVPVAFNLDKLSLRKDAALESALTLLK
ncbi:MAG: S41 family peptidase [Niastella sp.]|uniref:S41 family peptidase n=1 Tax=Niastella sp. TaxID=1869183 RepID=UPI00389A708D